jgi:hypothetical protein
MYQIQAYNETVSVVEAAISIFDPQVYVILLLLEFGSNTFQNLPLPLPPRRIHWNPLLYLQDLDRGPVPSNKTWRKGW